MVPRRERQRRAVIRAEGGAIVMGWLIKLTLALVVVAIIGYDAVAIAYNKVSTAEDARAVANAANEAIVLHRAKKKDAMEAALEQAHARGVELTEQDVVFDKKGAVTVTVTSDVTTVVTQYIGWLDGYTTAVETYSTKGTR